MKNLLILFSVIVMCSSCKKDWDCTCETTTTIDFLGFEETSTASATTTLEKLSEDDAESACTDSNGTTLITGGSVTVACSLD